MSAALAIEHADAEVDVVDDAEFELDMRVVESTTKLVIMMCDTSDGCGSTCSTSACTTFSDDPF
jgi:FxLD family lantipeptide